jgi:hypothetical protein
MNLGSDELIAGAIVASKANWRSLPLRAATWSQPFTDGILSAIKNQDIISQASDLTHWLFLGPPAESK